MHFHTSLTRAKDTLENNPDPVSFYKPLISAVIDRSLVVAKPNDQETGQDEEKSHILFFQYRGKVVDDATRALLAYTS